jgi:serine/threonine protein kinase
MNQYIAAPAAVQPLTSRAGVSSETPTIPGDPDASVTFAPLTPGAWLGTYRLEEQLGEGGFGQVFRARDQHGDTVAIKVICSAEEGFREAQVLQAAAHPSVPQLIETFLSPYGFCLVQEYVWGETVLARQLRAGGRLPVTEVLMTGWQVAATLAALHRHSPPVLHLDIKPGNLLLRQDGRIMLIDFGVATLVGGGWLVTGGTPAYMPPEQLVRRADLRSDVYALGATLWDLLAGDPPEPLDQRFPPLPGGCPRRLRYLLQHMLQLQPQQRPSSEEAAEQFKRLAEVSVRGSQRYWWLEGCGKVMTSFARLFGHP